MNPANRTHSASGLPSHGHVQLASGSWSWFTTVSPRPDWREPGGRWVVFWHEYHQSWTFRAKVDPDWCGCPSPDELARAAMRLSVEEKGRVLEIFFLPGHVFVQRGRTDVGVLLPHDGRPLAEMTESEIEHLLSRKRR